MMLLVSACTTSAHPAFVTSTSSTPTTTPAAIVACYLAAWNEHDPGKRHELVRQTWTSSGTYLDAHRHGEGVDGIDAMIAAAQAKFPAHRLQRASAIETHHGFVRFRWVAGGTPEAPRVLAGTDVFVLADDGRVQTVTGFVDSTTPLPEPVVEVSMP